MSSNDLIITDDQRSEFNETSLQTNKNTRHNITQRHNHESNELAYVYPPGTPGTDSANGYFWKLTESQQLSLHQLTQWAADNNININLLNPFALHPSLSLLRYLRANQFDVNKAIIHITKNLAWRLENNVNEQISRDPVEILGCSMSQLTELCPHWHSGYDKTGRPVLYRQYAKFDCSKLKTLTSLENVLKYHVWEQEQCMKLCSEQAHHSRQIIETISCVIDVGGMRMSQVTSDFLSVVKGLAQIDGGQYPETLGRMFIINTPSLFPVAWRMVRAFLDPVTASKIVIFGQEKDWQPALFEAIGKENMPATYGGDLGELSTEMHPYAESMSRLGLVLQPIVASQPTPTPRQRRKPRQIREEPNELAYVYPPGTPGMDSANGYFWKLTESQQLSLHQLTQWAADNNININLLNPFALHPSLTLLRYLRANQFDVNKAIIHITKNLAWRLENNVNEQISRDPAEILGCSMSQLTELFPHWHSGYDKTGRPVLYKQYAKFDCSKLKTLTSLEDVLKYHVWEQEQCMKLCSEQAHHSRQIIETISCVIDVGGMRMSQVTSDFLSVVKGLAQIDGGQYPETLGRMFIINTPSLFPVAWRMVRAFLDPVTASKIVIFGQEKDWQPALFEAIGKENMPATYGGDLGKLSTEVHPYAESMSKMIFPIPGEASRRNSRRYSKTQRLASNESHSSRLELNPVPDTITPSTLRDILLRAPSDSGLSDEYNTAYDYVEVGYLQQLKRQNSDQTLDSFRGGVTAFSWGSMRGRISRFIFSYTIDQLKFAMMASLGIYTLISVTGMIIGASIISTGLFSNTAQTTQLWTGVLLLLVCVAVIILNFGGFLGISYQNRQMLQVYASCVIIMSLVYFVVCVGSFVYAYDPSFAVFGSSSTQALVSLAACTLVAFLLSAFPVVSTLMLIHRLGSIQGLRAQPHQLRTVLLLAQVLSLVACLVMFAYGAASLTYLIDIGFSQEIFPVYGLIYGGMTLFLGCLMGLWVSRTVHTEVIWFYHRIVLPLVIIVLIVSLSVSFGAIPQLGFNISNFSSVLDPSLNTDSLQLLVETQLLVTGVLCLFGSLFQFVSLYSAYKLHVALSALAARRGEYGLEKDLETSTLLQGSDLLHRKIKLVSRDKCLITWSSVYGLWNIYIFGTYAIFASYVNDVSVSGDSAVWELGLWIWLGHYDARYSHADPFLVVSSVILAIVVGPCLLGHAWATFVKAPFRHILGTLLAAIQLFLCILFLALEINVGFVDYHSSQSAAFGFLILAQLIFGIIIPLVVFSIEFKKANSSAARADNHSLLMYVVRKEKYDISMYGSDFEGSNSSGDAEAEDASRNGFEYAASVSEGDEEYLSLDIGADNFESMEEANYRQPLLPRNSSGRNTRVDSVNEDEEKQSGYDSDLGRNNLSNLHFFRAENLALKASQSDGELTSLVSFRTATGEMKQDDDVSAAPGFGVTSKDISQQWSSQGGFKWQSNRGSARRRSLGKSDKPLISQDDLTALELMKSLKDKNKKGNFDSFVMMV